MMLASLAMLFAYTPFITPMHSMQPWWYVLVVPLAFGISLIYKSLHLQDMRKLMTSTLVMTAQIVLAVVALGLAVAIFVVYVIPRIPVH